VQKLRHEIPHTTYFYKAAVEAARAGNAVTCRQYGRTGLTYRIVVGCSWRNRVSVSTLLEGDAPVPRSRSAMVERFAPHGFCSIDSAFCRIHSIASAS
jgi:hypothetical protein